MEWLNHHHSFCFFWVVAKAGSIVAASNQLRLAHPTISGQIHRLEEVLGTLEGSTGAFLRGHLLGNGRASML